MYVNKVEERNCWSKIAHIREVCLVIKRGKNMCICFCMGRSGRGQQDGVAAMSLMVDNFLCSYSHT